MFASFFSRALTDLRLSTTTLDQLANSDTAASASSDEAQAYAEGWGVFDCGYREDESRRIELHRLDSPVSGTPNFDSDYAAWQHVAAAAKAGSRLHAAALSSLDPGERLAVEAACDWCPGL